MANIEKLTGKLDILKAKIKEAKKPATRQQAKTRQQKFMQHMKETGKKRVGFFLSDAAMGSIKKRKAETAAPSLNHALESLLTTPPPSATVPEVTTKTVTVFEPTAEQKAIIDQARKVTAAFHLWGRSSTGENAQAWKTEQVKLAQLFER